MALIMVRAAVPPQRRAYTIKERIQLLVNNYADTNIINFLRGISYNLA